MSEIEDEKRTGDAHGDESDCSRSSRRLRHRWSRRIALHSAGFVAAILIGEIAAIGYRLISDGRLDYGELIASRRKHVAEERSNPWESEPRLHPYFGYCARSPGSKRAIRC